MDFLAQFKGDSWTAKYRYEFNFTENLTRNNDRTCFLKIKLDELK